MLRGMEELQLVNSRKKMDGGIFYLPFTCSYEIDGSQQMSSGGLVGRWIDNLIGVLSSFSASFQFYYITSTAQVSMYLVGFTNTRLLL